MAQTWPIGGGKGGSGKSFLTGNLGISLARQGHRTLLIDLDFGAANLHTIVGVSHPDKSLSDFINKKIKTMEESIIETAEPNLSMISGAKNNLDIANLAYEQKAKILRAIAKLDYDYILLDLGAGTAFNTIDFFLISDSGIFVTTPEPTSIENVYRLTRTVYLRKVRQVLKADDFRLIGEEAVKRNNDTAVGYLEQFLHIAKELRPDKGAVLEEALQGLRFKLVVNQLRKQDNPNLGPMICRIIEKHLGINMQFFGNVSYDDRVHDAVCRRVSYISKYPYTQTSIDVQEFCKCLSNLQEADPRGRTATRFRRVADRTL